MRSLLLIVAALVALSCFSSTAQAAGPVRAVARGVRAVAQARPGRAIVRAAARPLRAVARVRPLRAVRPLRRLVGRGC